MARRPTMKDVAREAGLSVTTVDRALNGRSVVREETLHVIARAAERVGYHARGLLEHRLLAQVPELQLGFVLIKKNHEFYQSFAAEIEAACAARSDFRIKPVIRYAASQSPEEFASLLSGFRNRVSAVAAVAINHQKLNQAVQELNDTGVPVFSLLNDFGQGLRQSYLGLNNMKIGRLAAWMLTHAVKEPGKLGIFVGGNRWHGHDLREVGFRSFIREAAPTFSVLETLVNLETREVTYEATVDLLKRHRDLRGLYVAGGGMEGAIAALREIKAPGEVALIVNELTRDSRAALLDGYAVMAIKTPLQKLCEELVDMMAQATSENTMAVNTQCFMDPVVVLPEML